MEIILTLMGTLSATMVAPGRAAAQASQSAMLVTLGGTKGFMNAPYCVANFGTNEIVEYLCDTQAAEQRWFFDGNGAIQTLLQPGFCLAIDARDGAIKALQCDGGAEQRWAFFNGQIASVLNGKCLDVPGGQLGDGTALDLAPCSNNIAEVFVPMGPRVHLQHQSSQQCLSATNPGNGPLTVSPCDSAQTGQDFFFNFANPSGNPPIPLLALQAAKDNPHHPQACVSAASGQGPTTLDPWCSHTATEDFSYTGGALPDGAVVYEPPFFVPESSCLDLRANDPGQYVQEWACNGSAAQKWNLYMTGVPIACYPRLGCLLGN
jgi:hypothetical protein